ncbi:MAG: hypothetical protein PHI83_01390 [Sphaerochaetaceae bacterium]|nr:hypothetical protein [Sphaerochaetaceae bacterium]
MAEMTRMTKMVLELQSRMGKTADDRALQSDPGYIELCQGCMEFIYFYPQAIRRIDGEDASGFLLYVMPSVKSLILDFTYRGVSFESYLKAVIRFRMSCYSHSSFAAGLKASIAERTWAMGERASFTDEEGDAEPAAYHLALREDGDNLLKSLYQDAMYRLKNAMYHSAVCRKRASTVIFCLLPEASLLEMEVIAELLGYDKLEMKRIKEVFEGYQFQVQVNREHDKQLHNIYLLHSMELEQKMGSASVAEAEVLGEKLARCRKKMAGKRIQERERIRFPLKILIDLQNKPRGSVSSTVTLGRQMIQDALRASRGQCLDEKKAYSRHLRLEGLDERQRRLMLDARFSLLEDVGFTCLQLRSLIRDNAQRYGLVSLDPK